MFQSTLPRRERLKDAGKSRDRRRVSIHAPAKGATLQQCTLTSRALCFNPRSREGSDAEQNAERTCSTSFNPRSREGSDGESEDGRAGKNYVSIHAPAKGATRFGQRRAVAIWSFNPRSREGSDDPRIRRIAQKLRVSIHAPAKGATVAPGVRINVGKFQSTLPRRERPINNVCAYGKCMFQSTLPRRERQINQYVFQGRERVSIHAPAKGATGVTYTSTSSSRKFQSTLPRRERQHYRQGD